MLFEYKFKVDEAGGPEVKITEKSKWSGKFNVYVNGSPVEPVKEKKQFYPIPMPDGRVKKMVLKNVIFDPVPKVMVEEKEVLLARRLDWYEHVLALFWPIILLGTGGAIGGACGGAAVYFHYRVLRSSSAWPEKILRIFGISLAALICYIFVYAFLFAVVKGAAGKPAIIS